MKLELAGLLASPVEQLRLLENLATMRLQELGSFAAQLAGIGKELVSSQLERLVPLGPFSSLHPVFIFDQHDRAGGDQLVEELRDFLSQLRAALAQVGDQEVGQRLGIGPDACVRRPFVRQLTDQEDQRTNLISKVAILFLGLLGDLLGDFLKQDTGVQDSRLDVLVQKRPADHVPEWKVGGLLGRVVDDPELSSKLGTGSRLVHSPEYPLPETTANRENRVVLDQELPVTSRECDVRARELPLDFTHLGVEELRQFFFHGRLFLQHDLASDLLDVRVLQLDRDREPPLEAVEQGHSGQGTLPGGHEHDVGSQP